MIQGSRHYHILRNMLNSNLHLLNACYVWSEFKPASQESSLPEGRPACRKTAGGLSCQGLALTS